MNAQTYPETFAAVPKAAYDAVLDEIDRLKQERDELTRDRDEWRSQASTRGMDLHEARQEADALRKQLQQAERQGHRFRAGDHVRTRQYGAGTVVATYGGNNAIRVRFDGRADACPFCACTNFDYTETREARKCRCRGPLCNREWDEVLECLVAVADIEPENAPEGPQEARQAFRVGDRVRMAGKIKGPCGETTGTISDIDYDPPDARPMYCVQLDGSKTYGCFRAYQLEPIDKPSSVAFQVGDRVKIVQGAHRGRLGAVIAARGERVAIELENGWIDLEARMVEPCP